jgi:hypothetical protein
MGIDISPCPPRVNAPGAQGALQAQCTHCLESCRLSVQLCKGIRTNPRRRRRQVNVYLGLKLQAVFRIGGKCSAIILID